MALNNLGLGFTFQATDEASGTMDKVGKKLGQTGDKAKEAKVTLEKVGSELEGMGKKMAVAGAVGIGSLGLAANAASNFEYGVAQVGTEADKTKLPVSAVADIAKQMATTYGGDLDTQVKAMYQAVAAGADDATKSLNIMKAANELAIAGNTTQETALLGLTKVLNNYGLGFEHASEVSDTFFVAVRNGQTTVGELGEAIGQVAAISKSAGLSIDEMVGALGTAATMTKDTAGSAAAMKAALSGIAHPTADAAAEAAKLGIKFDSATLRSKGFVGFLQSITGSAKYSADSMNKLFGSVEASAFMSALAANDMSAMNNMMGAMASKAGGAKQATDEMSATMKQQASIMSASLEVAYVNVGEALLPLIKQTTAFATGAITWFAKLPKPILATVAAAVGIVSVFLLVVGSLVALAGGVMAVAAAWEVMAVALGVVVGVGGAFIVFGALAAGAFVAFRAAYEKNLGGFATFIDGAMTKAKLAFDGIVQLFSTGRFSGSVMTDMQKAENGGVMAFAIGVFTWVARIKNFFSGIATGFEGAMLRLGPVFTLFRTALDRIAKAFGFVKDAPEAAGRAFDAMGAKGYRVGSSVGDIFGTVVKVLTALANGVATGVEWWKKLSVVMAPLGAAFGGLFDSFTDLLGAFGGSQAAGESTTGAFERVGAVIAFVLSYVVTLITGFVNALSLIVAVASVVVTSVIDLFTGLQTFITGFFNLVVGFLTGDWKQAWLGAKQMVVGAVEVMNAILEAMIGTVAKLVDKILGLVGLKTTLGASVMSFFGGQSAAAASGAGLTPGGNPIPALPPPGANPGAVAAGALSTGASTTGGGGDSAPRTINVQIDGQTIATAVDKVKMKDNQRSLGPAPAPGAG